MPPPEVSHQLAEVLRDLATDVLLGVHSVGDATDATQAVLLARLRIVTEYLEGDAATPGQHGTDVAVTVLLQDLALIAASLRGLVTAQSTELHARSQELRDALEGLVECHAEDV